VRESKCVYVSTCLLVNWRDDFASVSLNWHKTKCILGVNIQCRELSLFTLLHTSYTQRTSSTEAKPSYSRCF
jgi:hypothetical protein